MNTRSGFPPAFKSFQPGSATGNVKNNFLLLMKASTADYICFSDQDDVWLPQKVSVSLQAMDRLESRWGKDLPLLVFTDLRVVDESLRTLQQSFWASENLRPHRIERLPALLAQNVVTGCTSMLNRPLINLSQKMTEKVFMHDQWIALLACTMGKAYQVKMQTVLYRQHGKNVIGSEQKKRSLSGWVQRARKTDLRLLQWKNSQRQARSFVQVHGAELSPEHRDVFAAYERCSTNRSRFVRIYTLFRYRFWRAGFLQKIATLLDQCNMKVEERPVD